MPQDSSPSRLKCDQRQLATFVRVVVRFAAAMMAAYVLYCFRIPHTRGLFIICYVPLQVLSGALALISLMKSIRYRRGRFLVYSFLAGTLAVLLYLAGLIGSGRYWDPGVPWLRNPFYF